MKKLMIAAAIVCAAAFAQAASYTWEASDSYIYSVNTTEPDWPAVAAGTPVYLAFVSAYSQADLVNDFANNAVDMGKFISGATTEMNAAGGISTTDKFTYDTAANQTAYFVIFEDGKMFVSGTAAADYIAVGTTPITFEKQDTFCLEGPDYKKSKGHVGEPVEAWYNKKWVSLACHRPYDPLSYSPALTDTLKEGFTFLVPYYRFFDRIYRSAD